MEEACSVGHPVRTQSLYPDEMRRVVRHELAKERTAEVRRWTFLAEEFKDAEKDMKTSLGQRRCDTLKGKRLLLFDRLLKDSMHGDECLPQDLRSGFDLTGNLPASNVFRPLFRPASVACADLRKVSDLTRDAMVKAISGTGDSELDNALMEATHKEVAKAPVDLADLPQGATITRRFAVKQKNKVRPIDDCKASGINSSVTQSEQVSIHSIDHIAAMIGMWIRCNEETGCSRGLTAKTWDLADAYKQVPLSDTAYRLDSYLGVFDPVSCEGKVFRQRVLPFGSIASVTAFLRLSNALWALGSRLLSLKWSCYFDDFLSLSESSLERHTDMIISMLFSLLGWKLSEHKLIPYDSVCKVLGVQLDLREVSLGTALVVNTDERIDELILMQSLDEALKSGVLSRKDTERLRGRLQFASSQIFGRMMRWRVKVLSKHLANGVSRMTQQTLDALEGIKGHLSKNIPRRITGNKARIFHIYVDASFDLDKWSGIGGMLVDEYGHVLRFFSEKVHPHLLNRILAKGQKTVIQELEMAAVLASLKLWGKILSEGEVVVFTDSESVRGSFLSNHSANSGCHALLHEIFAIEELLMMSIWIERVPSQSNPADILSREAVTELRSAERSEVDLESVFEALTRAE